MGQYSIRVGLTMRKEAVYRMPFEILKIILFCVSCLFFARPFLFSNGSIGITVPENSNIMLFLFLLSAVFESFDRLADEFKLPRKKKILSVFEVGVFFLVLMGIIISTFLDIMNAISVIAIFSSSVYFSTKLIRLGGLFNEYLL